jgi:hypothetical protein
MRDKKFLKSPPTVSQEERGEDECEKGKETKREFLSEIFSYLKVSEC